MNYYGGLSAPEAVPENGCDNYTAKNYWLLPDSVVDAGFVVDRGCQGPFNKVIIKNTHNEHANERYGRHKMID